MQGPVALYKETNISKGSATHFNYHGYGPVESSKMLVNYY
jgi:hypothetical protein